MTGGSARHGRRNNGLYAAEYSAVGDVDPRVGEHLLDVLGNRGIAAYLQPAADQHPITRLTTLPSRPTDRLYVDRAEVSTAREYLRMITADGVADVAAAELPATGAPTAPAARSSTEFEAAWASIIAGYETGAAGDTAPWPAAEDVVPAGPPGPATSTDTAPPPAGVTPAWPRWSGLKPDDPGESSLLDGLDRFGRQLPDEDEGDYEPPPPPPLPRFAGMTVFAVIAIMIGFVLVIVPQLMPFSTGGGAVVGGLFILVGAGTLIARLRPGSDDDPDDPDLGAVV